MIATTHPPLRESLLPRLQAMVHLPGHRHQEFSVGDSSG
jgi:hypothetical protein